MDMTFTAAPMNAAVVMTTAFITAHKVATQKAIVRMAQVVIRAYLSIGGVSLSAIAPDHIFEGGTALGAA